MLKGYNVRGYSGRVHQCGVGGDYWGGVRRDRNGGVGVVQNVKYYGRRYELALMTLDWCNRYLCVGEGDMVGERFRFMGWFGEFIKACYGVGIHEAGLSIARKNGKTASLAAWEVGCLVGPLRREGYSCLVVSEDKRKAGPFKESMVGMCVESGLMSRDDKRRGVWQEGLGIGVGGWVLQVLVRRNAGGDELYSVGRRVGYGGEGQREFGKVRILPFGDTVGDALRANKVIIDEGGRLGNPSRGGVATKQRRMWNSLRSAMGSGGDLFVVMSAQYNGSMFREMRESYERGENDRLVFLVHSACEGCALDDEVEWERANPALEYGVKDRNNMRGLCRTALVNDSDEVEFREQELNQPQGESLKMLVSEGIFRGCVQRELVGDIREHRRGGCFVGIDMGTASSMSCIALGWYGSGFVELYGAFPGLVRDKVSGGVRRMDLVGRGARDGVSDSYARFGELGELWVYEDQFVVPYGRFFADVWNRVGLQCDGVDHRMLHIAMDFHRQANYYQAVHDWVRGRMEGARVLDSGSVEALEYPSFRKGPDDKDNDIRNTQEFLIGGRFYMCVGYGGGLGIFSVRNASLKDVGGKWNFVKFADGKNDAVVAMSVLAGMYKREDQLRKEAKNVIHVAFA